LELCSRIAEKIGKSLEIQFSPLTTARNATEFMSYLADETSRGPGSPEIFLEPAAADALASLRGTRGISAAEVALPDRLFIGGLPFDVTANDIRDVFQSHGVALRDITLPVEHASGRNRGFGFIVPKDRLDVLLAIDLDGVIAIAGRRLRISEAHKDEEEHVARGGRVRSAPPLSKRIYVAKLPREFGVGDIRALLAGFDITSTDIFLMKDRSTGLSRGACFVEVHSLDEAARAIGALNGVEVAGQKILARPADLRD